MKNITSILATVALGAALAIGPATMSMAHGGGGGHGGGRGGGHADHSDHGFGSRGFGERGFDGGRGVGSMGFGADRSVGDRAIHRELIGPPEGHDHDTATYCLRLHPTYDPSSGIYFGPDGVRHYCP
jgi:hypothetical protein